MAFDPNKITFFARTDARGKNVQFGIKAKDRQRHVYVIGKTGMGKSTLLENMAVQDIENGEGMAFIDPHGSAAETLLNYIPEHRVKDVLYFAPFDTDYPVSFNIMEDVGPDRRHLVVSGLMSVFEKIWVDAWSARMAYILQNTLMALLEFPDSTLLGVNRMLSDKDYRKLVVDNVKDPGVRSFWVDEFAKYNERYMQEAGDAIKNKIGQFTANPIIRNIIGQPKSSFDIRKIMDEKKILIMNLSKGLIGETNANLLGSMLTTRIYLAAMSRADLSPEKMREMPNFYFYVDEFQSFANATFANILSEARKYHLNLTIAHQYIEQMEEEVRNAVFGNVGTIISFRVGPFDAEVLETIYAPQFTATDIVNLSFAQIYLTLMIDGIGSQPFSATTLPPIAPPSISYRDMTVAASRTQFTRARTAVEEDIHRFHEPIIPPRVEKKQFPAKEYGKEGAPARKPDRPQERGERTERRERVERTEKPPESRVQPSETVSMQTPEPQGEKSEAVPSRPPEPVPVVTIKRERPPERKPERRPPVNPQQKSPQVEDLRSMLRAIVAQADKQTEKVPPLIHVSEKENSSKKESNLKDVLGAVLHDVSKEPRGEEKNEPVSTPVQVIKTSVGQSLEITQNQHTEKADRDTTQTEIPRIPPKKEHEIKERTLPTPKELERMMRITTSDKPPL